MFDDNQTVLKLILGCILFLPGLYFFARGNERYSLVFLILGAFTIRLVMVSLDPFLHDWDERFHALVAKNMMSNPFKPMLRVDPVLPFDYKAWCCNHIWVHKQPLFLWQMALAMKIFGVNVIALRLPNVIMGTLAVYFVYRILRIWTDNFNIAYFAALLYAVSYYQLELSSGHFSLEHNDVAFTFYVTASLWSYCEYTRQPGWKYALLTGIFAGAAILVKWLTGLLVFGGWGLYVLLDRGFRTTSRSYIHIAGALLLCLTIALPWQFYILKYFPQEAAWSYAYNRMHIFEDLEHPGGPSFHFVFAGTMYGKLFLPFIFVGLFFVIRQKIKPVLSFTLIVMLATIYLFFSFVATKMPAFPFPVSAIVFGLISIGIINLWQLVKKPINPRLQPYLFAGFILAMSFYCLKPWEIVRYRGNWNEERNTQIHNTAIYRQVGQEIPADYVVLNCKSFEDTELMFWQPVNAYHWFPAEKELQELLDKGYKVAAFQSHGEYGLPGYIQGNPAIRIIQQEIK